MSGKHGGYRYTNDKCKCTVCKKAHAMNIRRFRAQRAERLRHDPTLAEHGKEGTYCNWICRCTPCREAHSASQRERRQRRASGQQG